MRSFSVRERECEATFLGCGPYWHAFTSGKNTPTLFTSPEDLVFVMNVIAQSAYMFKPAYAPDGSMISGVRIIAFEVMNNHFHFVGAGSQESFQEFFAFIRRRLTRTIPAVKTVELCLKQITDLTALRNNIVYTHRNGYVANDNYTPFSYPWGSGCDYYCDRPATDRYGDIYLGPRRTMFRGRAPELPEDWPMRDGYIAPTAYCAIRFGMSLFRDAHHYFNAISRQVESYGEIALEMGEMEFLTDAELFSKVTAVVRERFKLNGIKDLSKAQKLDLARTLHYDYRSSNGQIRRTLGLTQYEVDAMFPLSAE